MMLMEMGLQMQPTVLVMPKTSFVFHKTSDDEDDDEILRLDGGGGGFVVFVGESDLSCRGARRKPLLPPLLSIVAATAI